MIRESLQARHPGDVVEPRDFGLAPLEAIHAPAYLQFLQHAHSDWRREGHAGDAIPWFWPNRAVERYTQSTGAKLGLYARAGDGLGANLNIPLPKNTGYRDWAKALQHLLDAARNYSVEALVVSLGVDTFEDDPISFFKLATDDFSMSDEAFPGSPSLPCSCSKAGTQCRHSERTS